MGLKDKNHLYLFNFLTFSAKIYAETLNKQRTKLNIWIENQIIGLFGPIHFSVGSKSRFCEGGQKQCKICPKVQQNGTKL